MVVLFISRYIKYIISKCNILLMMLYIAVFTVAYKISLCIIQDIVHNMSRSNISLRMSKQICAIYSENERTSNSVMEDETIFKQLRRSQCEISHRRSSFMDGKR